MTRMEIVFAVITEYQAMQTGCKLATICSLSLFLSNFVKTLIKTMSMKSIFFFIFHNLEGIPASISLHNLWREKITILNNNIYHPLKKPFYGP